MRNLNEIEVDNPRVELTRLAWEQNHQCEVEGDTRCEFKASWATPEEFWLCHDHALSINDVPDLIDRVRGLEQQLELARTQITERGNNWPSRESSQDRAYLAGLQDALTILSEI